MDIIKVKNSYFKLTEDGEITCKVDINNIDKSDTIDDSQVFWDFESEIFTTKNRLKEVFANDAERIEEYEDFNTWLNEITSKNGSVEYVYYIKTEFTPITNTWDARFYD